MNAIPLISLFDFPGGVHPPENKEQSTRTAIATPPLPEILIIPLSQNSGAPAQAVVTVGEKVLKGQLLGRATGFVSAPVHAPTSGTIIAMDMHPAAHHSGLEEYCLFLKPDGLDQWCELHPLPNYTKIDPEELVQRIYDAGVVGLGGAGFPAAVKMASRKLSKIHTLIINGAECEPYITCDDMLMRERAEQIVSGIQILEYILQPEQILIGIEDNKPEALLNMANACTGKERVNVFSVPTKYPSGDAQRLIWLLTGKEVPSDGRSVDIGIICYNVGTVLAVHDAIVEGKPLISRITTLTGEALKRPGNVETLIGTPVHALLQFAGLQEYQLSVLIQGGPMMGITLETSVVPIIKTSNCIIAGSHEEFPPSPPAQPCIRCGDCASACPLMLQPQQLYFYAKSQNHPQLFNQNLFDCIECGACAYVCPSAIPLVQYYRAAKDEIRHQRLRSEKSEQSRLRFEQRQARLELAAAEKESRRKANLEKARRLKEKQAAIGEGIEESDDPVKAALARVQARKAAKALANPASTLALAGPEEAHTIADTNVNGLAVHQKELTTEKKQLKMRMSMAKVQLKQVEKAHLNATEEDARQQLFNTIGQLKEQLTLLEREFSGIAASSDGQSDSHTSKEVAGANMIGQPPAESNSPTVQGD